MIALDLRNHGASAHAPDMSYPAMADDVLETLRAARRAALRAGGPFHGRQGGDDGGAASPGRRSPGCWSSDIAPVRYPPAFRDLAQAMAAIPLHPGLTRAEADAALAAVAAPGVRAFLLQNLRFGAAPHWRIDLPAIAAALPVLEDWPHLEAAPYAGPALFVAGARSDYIRPEHRPAIRALFPAARFVTVKDAGHWVHADNPSGFAAVLEAFLAPG